MGIKLIWCFDQNFLTLILYSASNIICETGLELLDVLNSACLICWLLEYLL